MTDISTLVEDCNERLDAERVKIEVLTEEIKRLNRDKQDLRAALNHFMQTRCEG